MNNWTLVQLFLFKLALIYVQVKIINKQRRYPNMKLKLKIMSIKSKDCHARFAEISIGTGIHIF